VAGREVGDHGIRHAARRNARQRAAAAGPIAPHELDIRERDTRRQARDTVRYRDRLPDCRDFEGQRLEQRAARNGVRA